MTYRKPSDLNPEIQGTYWHLGLCFFLLIVPLFYLCAIFFKMDGFGTLIGALFFWVMGKLGNTLWEKEIAKNLFLTIGYLSIGAACIYFAVHSRVTLPEFLCGLPSYLVILLWMNLVHKAVHLEKVRNWWKKALEIAQEGAFFYGGMVPYQDTYVDGVKAYFTPCNESPLMASEWKDGPTIFIPQDHSLGKFLRQFSEGDTVLIRSRFPENFRDQKSVFADFLSISPVMEP